MASVEDDLAYLQPDFDPTSLTVPRLRSVLLTHGISYPSSAKKADLVQVFNDELKPQAKKILSARRRTQRSSKGIEDAASSMASSLDATEDEETPATSAPTTGKKPRGRPKKSVAAEDSESTLVPTTASKSARSKSRGGSKAKTVEPVESPSLKQETSDPKTWQNYSKDSPFSKDNPFQSGSSPISAPAPVPKRRKTEGPETKESKETKKKPSSSRRKTDTPSTSETVVKSRTTKMPVQDVVSGNEADIDISEEFTPEEQQEIEEERRKGNMAVLPIRRTAARSDGISWKSPIIAILLVLFSGITGLWRQEKLNVGYCGIGQPSDSIYGVDIPVWADSLRPQCEICPQHAICHENLQTECENGFVVRQNLLSLNGLLPLVPSCEADGEKAKRVKAVADRMEDELRKRRASVECGITDEKGEPIVLSEITEEDLKASVAAKRRKGMSDQEFNNLFEDAVPELSGREEIVVTLDEQTGTRKFASTSLAKISIGCSIKLTLGRFTRPALALISVIILILGLLQRWKTEKAIEQEAKLYASEVFSNLADYAAAVAQEPINTARDGFVSVTQLRDDVLRNEFSSSRRKKLWSRVERLVEQNSNVRTRIGSLDSGDVGRGWKWIGSIRQLDDSDIGRSSSRRGSGRYSLPPPPPEIGSSPMTEIDVANPIGFRRWENAAQSKF